MLRITSIWSQWSCQQPSTWDRNTTASGLRPRRSLSFTEMWFSHSCCNLLYKFPAILWTQRSSTACDRIQMQTNKGPCFSKGLTIYEQHPILASKLITLRTIIHYQSDMMTATEMRKYWENSMIVSEATLERCVHETARTCKFRTTFLLRTIPWTMTPHNSLQL